MLRRILFFAIALCVAASARATALPGQTEAQIASWGKHIAALHGFQASTDDETGGIDYLADVAIDGNRGYFHAGVKSGIVYEEYVVFNDVDNVPKKLSLIADTIQAIYGADYANDFRAAPRVPHIGRVAVWKGKRMSYFAFSSAVFFSSNADFAAFMKNVRTCDALDCSDGD